jgi:hypothetical protein
VTGWMVGERASTSVPGTIGTDWSIFAVVRQPSSSRASQKKSASRGRLSRESAARQTRETDIGRAEQRLAQIQAFRASRRRGVAIGFATSRAQSMKSCAAGVNVRFFKVIMPTGPLAARSIGRTLMERSQPPNLRTDSEAIERKCPFATRAIRATPVAATMAGRGSSSPIARNTSVSNVWAWSSGGGSAQGSLIRSASFIRRRTAALRPDRCKHQPTRRSFWKISLAPKGASTDVAELCSEDRLLVKDSVLYGFCQKWRAAKNSPLILGNGDRIPRQTEQATMRDRR